jgi:hypothetical protein
MLAQIVRKELPPLNDLAIERAVKAFTEEVDVKGNVVGFFKQTMAGIHAAVFEERGDFWLSTENGEVLGYLMGRMAFDVDNELTYWLSQAWIAPQLRRTPIVKQWFEQIRAHAKTSGCKHIIVVSGRGADAYCRFLGKGWHTYATLLKEDI